MTTVSSTPDPGILSPDQLLAKVRDEVLNGKKSGPSSDPSILTAQQLLNRAKARASGQAVAAADTVQISAAASSRVTALLKATADKAKATATPYTEQDWYLKAKVAQLKSQIATYQNLPDLDPGGNIMDALTKEVHGLLKKQADKLKAAKEKGDAAKKELEAQQKAIANAPPTADQLLAKFNGKPAGLSAEVQALLDKAKQAAEKGSTVNKTA